jgi:hypothetical protein
MTILLFGIKLEMVFSSHVTLGNYTFAFDYYWANYTANLDLDNAFRALVFLSSWGSACAFVNFSSQFG